MAKLKKSDSAYDSGSDLEVKSKCNAKLMAKLKNFHSEEI